MPNGRETTQEWPHCKQEEDASMRARDGSIEFDQDETKCVCLCECVREVERKMCTVLVVLVILPQSHDGKRTREVDGIYVYKYV